MFPATILLQHLTEPDITQLIGRLAEKHYLADQLIIAQGEAPGKIYFVINGVVTVYVEDKAGQRRELAQLGAGEILGDVSLLDGSPASACVRAKENSVLATVEAVDLVNVLASDAGFASRFYRGLAVLNAARVRRLTGQLAQKEIEQSSLTHGESAALLRRVNEFKDILLRADREAIAAKGIVKSETARQANSMFNGLLEDLNDFMNRPGDDVPEYIKQAVGALAQREFLPYLTLSRFAERSFAKPRGYAGDYETIAQVYENKPTGTGRLGPLLDGFFLARPAAQATRNRRGLLAREIQSAVTRSGRASVTSLACGPAQEVFDTFAHLDEKAKLKCAAVDIDPKAVELVTAHAANAGLTQHITAHRANLVYLATGREKLELSAQDLVYSIGLIDYFQDEFVVRLLDWIHGLLTPGGRVILGNFHPRNPDRALLDYVLEWKLIYRTEKDMNRLFRASKFNAECSRILFEEQGINLFAEGIKKG